MGNAKRALSSVLAIMMAVSMVPSNMTVFATESSHVHTDSCYSLTCSKEEGHTHEDDCYEIDRNSLVCGKDGEEGHEHSDSCYEKTLVCSKEENHVHGDGCYTLSCGKSESKGAGNAGSNDGANAAANTANVANTATGQNAAGTAGQQVANSADVDTSSEEPGDGDDGSGDDDKEGSDDEDPDPEEDEEEEIVEPDEDDITEEEQEEEAEEQELTDPGEPTDDSETVELTLPKTEEDLSSILGKNEDGSYKMYTTLYDVEGRVVDTNDPNYEKDEYYKSEEDGGKAGTLNLDASLDVRFRIEEIIANEDGGVKEDVTYVSDVLPVDLVPYDKEGTLLNPDTPATFIQTSGDIEAYGGLYGDAENGYKFKMFFRNAVDRIDISGTYQYGATINLDTVKAGDEVTLDYGPAGTVGFKVTEEEKEPEKAQYGMYISEHQGYKPRTAESTYQWQTVITRNNDADTNVFPYHSLTLTNTESSGLAFWINQADQTIFDNYDLAVSGSMTLQAVYKDDEGDITANNKITITKDNILEETVDGKTIIRVKDEDHNLQVDLTFSKSKDLVEGSLSTNNGKSSYLTRTVTADISDGNGGDVQGFANLVLQIPVIVYDDYKTTRSYTSQYRQVNAELKISLDKESDVDIDASREMTTISNTYTASLGQLYLGPDAMSNTSQFAGMYGVNSPQNLAIGSSGHAGSYFWFEYTPDVENNQSVKIYQSGCGLAGQGLLTSNVANGGATFYNLYFQDSSGTKLTDWDYQGEYRIGQLLYSSPFPIPWAASDAKLKYQLYKVFEGSNTNDKVIFYKSRQKAANGKYMYLVIDPSTVEKAESNLRAGWYEYTELGSMKPGSWKIHVFNAPTYGQLYGSIPTKLGAVVNTQTTPTSASGLNVCKLTTGTAAGSTNTSQYTDSGSITGKDAYLNARWVDEDTIFWEMVVSTSRWPEWKNSNLFVSTGEGLTFDSTGKTVTVNGQELSTNKIYANKYDTTLSGSQATTATNWEAVGSYTGSSWNQRTTINDISAAPVGLKYANSNQAGVYSLSASKGFQASQYVYYQSGDKSKSYMVLGFFTKASGKPKNSEYTCTAQFVMRNADISGLGYQTVFNNSTGVRTDPRGTTSQFPIKVTAAGSTSLPTFAKSGSINTESKSLYNGVVADWDLKFDNSFTSAITANGNSKNTNMAPYTDIDWIYSNQLRNYGYSGGFSGNLLLADTMKESTATGSQGENLAKDNEDLNPAKYTYITSIFNDKNDGKNYVSLGRGAQATYVQVPTANYLGNSSGYWSKYNSGEWTTINGGNNTTYGWNPKEAGIYKGYYFAGPFYDADEKNRFNIVIYYAGNMADSVSDALADELATLGVDASQSVFKNNSLVIEFRNLNFISDKDGGKVNTFFSPKTISYTTELDADAYLAALAGEGDPTTSAYANVSLKNSASCGNAVNAGVTSSTAAVTKRIAMYLGIDKAVTYNETSTKSGTDIWYDLTATTGSYGTGTPYLEIEDYVTGFDNITSQGDMIDGGSYTTDADPETIRALTKHLSVKNVIIRMTEKDGTKTTIYTGSEFIAGWDKNSTIELCTDEDYSSEQHPNGSLFKVTIQPDEGNIANDTSFTISYQMHLDTDTTLDDDGHTFRESDYYRGNFIQIGNGASASRSMAATNSSTKSARKAPARISGRKDNAKQTLTVDSGAIASGVMLKEATTAKQSGMEGTWTAEIYTGTAGKAGEGRKVTISDNFDNLLSSFTYTAADGTNVSADSLPETQRNNVLELIKHIIAKHSAYSGIKVYMTDKKMPEATKNPDVLETSDKALLLWDGGSETSFLVDGTTVKGDHATADGLGNLDIKADADKTSLQKDITLKDDAGKLLYDGSIKLTTIPSTLSSVLTEDGYNLVRGNAGLSIEVTGTDYDKHLYVTYSLNVDWEAVEKEARDFFGTYTFSGQTKNEIKDDKGHSGSATGTRTEVSSMSIGKSVKADSKNGTADWTVTADTSSFSGDSFVISDTINIALPEGTEDRVKTAAEKATSIDPSSMTITLAGTTIYSDGKVTADGWSDENVDVAIDGLSFDVTFKNTDGGKVLAKNQKYTVTYKTKFNKNAYILNGGKEGDSFIANNTASFNGDGTGMSADTKAEFAPEIPVTASKTFNGQDGNLATWTVTAATGDAGRKEFSLTDTITAPDEASKSAISIESMYINVETGGSAEEGHTIAQYTPDDLPEGVTLTKADGSEFKLHEAGTTDFKLTYDELAVHGTVTVVYTARLDRAKYLENGGSDDADLTLSNALHVSAADGYMADAGKDGTVSVKKPYGKEGKITKETSENGNPVISWTMDVNLSQQYTDEELKSLEEVTLTDELSPVLSLVDGSVTVKDTDGSDVPFELAVTGRKLQVTIKEPSEHANVTLSFKTECAASMDALVNEASVSIDGKQVSKIESEDIGEIHANGQKGTIQSAKVPVYTPTATKYVDGKICTTADLYQFTLTAVDENGNVLTGDNAYTDTARNDGEGKIIFKEIKIKERPGKGETKSFYYQMMETGDAPEDKYTYTVLDKRVFTVRVDVTQVSGGYVVAETVTTPRNYPDVRFDNTKKDKTTEYTVTKVWSDNDNKYGTRPDQILVHLYQNGEPYNNTIVTLNEDNGWTYTWTNLPVAGGDYSVAEEDVAGYTSSSKTKDNKTTITNTLNTTECTVTKEWKDNNNSYGVRPESITVHLYKDGEVYRDISAVLNKDNKWTYKWTDLPAGGKYSVVEDEVANYKGTADVTDNKTTLTNEVITTSHMVTKVWKDNDNSKGIRPKSVTVHLYKDGKICDGVKAVELNEKNSWTYTWTDLLADGKYSAAEDNVDGYKGTSEVTDGKTVLTNTIIEDSKGSSGGSDDSDEDEHHHHHHGDSKSSGSSGTTGSTSSQAATDASTGTTTENQTEDTSGSKDTGNTQNTSSASMNTGDSSHIELWLALMIAAAGCLGVYAAWMAKRRK